MLAVLADPAFYAGAVAGACLVLVALVVGARWG